VVLAFAGPNLNTTPPAGVVVAETLEDAAIRVVELLGGTLAPAQGVTSRPPTGGYIRGLYGGGTLCAEAMTIVSQVVGRVASTSPLRPDWALADVNVSERHTFIDFGHEALTDGVAHPMIDLRLRIERFEREACDRAVGVIVLDLVLGLGAHHDPAAELAPAIAEALARRDELGVIIAVCASRGDPQDTEAQIAALAAAGAVLVRSNAAAARAALVAAAEHHV
jgi:FdrA protein